MINYNKKKFRPVYNVKNGETTEDTVFHYFQNKNIVTASYSGGKIINGHLIGIVLEDGSIEMRYHQVNIQNTLMTGICHSIPEIMSDGRVRLHENWEWTSGDFSKGTSIIDEVFE